MKSHEKKRDYFIHNISSNSVKFNSFFIEKIISNGKYIL